MGDSTKGYIETFGLPWKELKKKYNIDQVDMFKMNIEGSEIAVLDSIEDFSKIKRFAIECHDFRADRGHGDHFRTKKHVIETLEKNGYTVTESNKLGVKGEEWADHWIRAERIS